jgi:hypothetical protein
MDIYARLWMDSRARFESIVAREWGRYPGAERSGTPSDNPLPNLSDFQQARCRPACSYLFPKQGLSRREFKSQIGSRIARTVHNRSWRVDLVIAAYLECGVRAQRDLGYPKTNPKKLWLQVEVGGRPWTSQDAKATQKTRFSAAYWTSSDVYGSPWMAPRAGFELERKLLNVHVIVCVEQLSTPARTPFLSKLEFSPSPECIDAFARWPTDTVPSSAE